MTRNKATRKMKRDGFVCVKLMFSQEFVQIWEYIRAEQHGENNTRTRWLVGPSQKRHQITPLRTQSGVIGSVARQLHHTSGPLKTQS